MIGPGAEAFKALAKRHRVVPVWREIVGDLVTPVAAFARIVGEGPGFLLESVEHGQRWGRFSFVGRSPLATLTVRGNHVDIDGAPPAIVPDDLGALAALEAVLAQCEGPDLPALPPLHGGVVGFLGYGVVDEIETRRPDGNRRSPEDDLRLPDAILYVIGQLAVFDHWRQRVTIIDNVPTPVGLTDGELDDLYVAAEVRIQALAEAGAVASPEPVFDPPSNDAPPTPSSPTSRQDYCRAVDAAREKILDGDAFQVVLAQRFDIDLDGAEPFDIYRVLRQVNPSPYMYFLRHREVTLLGSSPEPLVQVRAGRVISRPIAGTRPRSSNEEADRRLGAELAEHPKERAEHVMLVDLARNDLGRISAPGSVNVESLMVLERFSHVMHLTSQVSGVLAPGVGPVDVIRATFPAGTVSGAPKVAAMEIIDDLEPVSRGPYAGVVGYFDFTGNLDVAITIRTMVVEADRAHVHAGAGIVAASDPDAEYEECRNKAAALLAAVPPARRMGDQRRELAGSAP